MLSTFIAIVLSLFACPLQADQKPSASPPVTAQGDLHEKLHADAVKLVEISGARDRVKANLGNMVDQGKKAMAEKCPTCGPEFIDEWGKRMMARLNVEDFVEVAVRAYETHLTDAEIDELIEFLETKKANPAAEPAPALKERLVAVMPDLMADIMAGSVKIASKLGGEIGSEIEKEHPEWMKAQQSSKPPDQQ